MSNSAFSRRQIIDLKYHAQQLKDHANVVYWAASEHDKTWHEAEALDHLRSLLVIAKEAVL